MTPYEIVNGQPPPVHIPYLPGDSVVNIVDRSLAAREAVIHKLQHNLHKSQNRMKQLANRQRSDREFNEGDWV